MYQEDYILRHVSVAAQAIARIMGLNKAGQYHQARQEIDQALREFLGVSAELAAQLSVSELLMISRSGNLLDNEKALLLASLLKEEGEICAAQNQPIDGTDSYIKSLNIALEALTQADAALGREYLALVEELTGKLGEDSLDSGLRYELSRYYELIGEPAKARSYRVPAPRPYPPQC